MPEPKPRYANFPEREMKVVLGPHLNATTMKALGRLSIGTYEMSVAQQERGKVTTDACRHAVNALAKELQLTSQSQESRDFLISWVAQNDAHEFKVWVTPPFESGQSAHLVWTKYVEKGGEGKVGVAFKLATGFTTDDILNQLKQAQKNAIKLDAGQPFELKGNPPPRFQKKAKAEAPATPADAAAADAAATQPEQP